MKKFFKYFFIVLGVVLILAGGAGLYIHFTGIPKYEVHKIDYKVEATPARLERGKKLVSMLCVGCHFNETTNGLTGKRMADLPPAFGTVYSRNITKDPTFGIGKWSDADIVYLLRTGLKPDGQYVPPYMVKLPHISDEDMASIITFIRSDDPLVQPQAIQDTDCKPTFLVKFLSRVAFKPFDYPTQPIATPLVTDRVAYGKYLVNDVLKCYECHSADFKTNNAFEPVKSEGYMAGDNELLDISGKKIYTPNLTTDPGTNISKWSEQQFVRTIKEGFRPDNSPLRYPMERLPELTDEEAGAIYAYLKTVPAIKKDRRPAENIVTTAGMNAGQQVYHKYMCYTCHGEAGAGVCDLRKAGQKYPADSSLIAWIKNPSKIVPGTKMPNWEGVIGEDEYQPLAQYVRALGEQARLGGDATKASMTAPH